MPRTKAISRWTRLHHLLGRCGWCWRRSSATLTIQGLDDDDQPTTESLVFHVCDRHVEKTWEAVLPVADTATFEFENGTAVTFSEPGQETPAVGDDGS